jgi:hypothetical protein
MNALSEPPDGWPETGGQSIIRYLLKIAYESVEQHKVKSRFCTTDHSQYEFADLGF